MNKLIITGGYDGIVRVHNIDTHSLIQSLRIDNDYINCVLKGEDNTLYIGGNNKLYVL